MSEKRSEIVSDPLDLTAERPDPLCNVSLGRLGQAAVAGCSRFQSVGRRLAFRNTGV